MAEAEPAARRRLYFAWALLLVAGFFAVTHVYWAPAHWGADQNGYLVGGKMFADHLSTRLSPLDPATRQVDPYSFVGTMWVGADLGASQECYYPKYPIGLPVLVAAALKFAGPAGTTAAYLISPVAMALGLLAVFLILRLAVGSLPALLGMVAVMASPVTLGLTNNPNSHAATLCCVAWGMYFLIRWWQANGRGRAFAAGFFLGYALTIRYTEGLLLLPLGLVAVFNLRRRKESWLQAGLLLAGWLLPVIYLLAHNEIAFGSLTGYDATNESTGFAWEYFQDNWETMLRGLYNTALFFLFPFGLLGLVLLLRLHWRFALFLWSWLLPGLLLYTAYYWAPEQGNPIGYMRFFLTLLPPLALGAVYALGRLDPAAPRESGRTSSAGGAGTSDGVTEVGAPGRPRHGFASLAPAPGAEPSAGGPALVGTNGPGTIHAAHDASEETAGPPIVPPVPSPAPAPGGGGPDTLSPESVRRWTAGLIVALGCAAAAALLYAAARARGGAEPWVAQSLGVAAVLAVVASGAGVGLLGERTRRRSAWGGLVAVTFLGLWVLTLAGGRQEGRPDALAPAKGALVALGCLAVAFRYARAAAGTALAVALGGAVGVNSAADMLEHDHRAALTVSLACRRVLEEAPPGSVVFGPEHVLNPLQFAGDYQLYGERVVGGQGARRLNPANVPGAPDDPQPLQPQRAKAMYDRLKEMNDAQLVALQRKIVGDALGHGRRVFFVAPRRQVEVSRVRLFSPAVNRVEGRDLVLQAVGAWDEPEPPGDGAAAPGLNRRGRPRRARPQALSLPWAGAGAWELAEVKPAVIPPIKAGAKPPR